MRKKSLNKIISFMLILTMIFSIGGCSIFKKDKQSLSTEYYEQMESELSTAILNELDTYITKSVTDEVVKNVITEEVALKISESVIGDISSENKELSKAQKKGLKKIVTAVLTSDAFKEMQIESQAQIHEDTKAIIANRTSEIAKDIIKEVEIKAKEDTDGNVNVSSDYDSKLKSLKQSLNKKIKSLEKKVSAGSVTYTLSDDDMATIKEVIKETVNASGIAAGETKEIEDKIAASVTEEVKAYINKELGGASGKDGYTPIKGTDYFTPSEIESIVGSASESVLAYILKNGISGEDGKTPVKGEDYFTKEDVKEISKSVYSLMKADGADVYVPEKGVDYFTAEEILDVVEKTSALVKDGKDGKDGKTPVKGEDYFTEDEINTVVSQITNRVNRVQSAGGSAYIPIKGEDYFTDAEIASITNTVTNSVTAEFESAMTDLEEQITERNETIESIDISIELFKEQLAEHSSTISNHSASLAGNNQDIKYAKEQVLELNTQIDTLEEAQEELKTNKLDLATYTQYQNSMAASIGSLTESDKELNQKIADFKVAVNETFDEIEEKISEVETGEGGASSESVANLRNSFNTFKTEVVGEDGNSGIIGNLQRTCNSLSATKLNNADFESFQEEEKERLQAIESDISDSMELLGNFDIETGDYDTVTEAIVSIQDEIVTFKSDYADAQEQVFEDYNHITEVIGNKADGSIYEDYEGSLWQAASELTSAVTEFKEEQTTVNADTLANVTSIEDDLTSFKNTSANNLSAIQTDITEIQENAAEKLDIVTFVAYQSDVDGAVNELDAQLGTIKTEFDIKTDSLDASLSDAMDSIGANAESVDEAKAAIDVLRVEIATNKNLSEEQKKQLNARLDTLSESLDSSNSQIRTLIAQEILGVNTNLNNAIDTIYGDDNEKVLTLSELKADIEANDSLDVQTKADLLAYVDAEVESRKTAIVEAIDNIYGDSEKTNLTLSNLDEDLESYVDAIYGKSEDRTMSLSSLKNAIETNTDMDSQTKTALTNLIDEKYGALNEDLTLSIDTVKNDLTSSITTLDSTMTVKVDEVKASVNAEVTNRENAITTVTNELTSALNTNVEAIETELSDISDLIGKNKTISDEEFERVDGNISALSETVSNNNTNVLTKLEQETQERTDAMDAMIEDIYGNADKETTVEDILNKITANENMDSETKTQLLADIEANADRIESNKTELTDLITSKDEATNKLVSDLTATVSDMNTTLTEKDTDLQTQITNLQTAWETFKGTSTLTLADIESRFTNVENDISELNTNLASKGCYVIRKGLAGCPVGTSSHMFDTSGIKSILGGKNWIAIPVAQYSSSYINVEATLSSMGDTTVVRVYNPATTELTYGYLWLFIFELSAIYYQ